MTGALPERGRTFRSARRVRLGDAEPSGRLRLDALARYLQDVANDDAVDAQLEDAMSWVVRRLSVTVRRWPRIHDNVELITFCSGTGSRWAERRTLVMLGSDTEPAIDAAALWVFFDAATGRPAPLTERFYEVYAEAAAGRTVSSRLQHKPPPERASARPWIVRRADLDVLGHVNNAVALAAVEEVFAATTMQSVTVEYRDAIECDDGVMLVTDSGRMWLTVAGAVRVSAEVITA